MPKFVYFGAHVDVQLNASSQLPKNHALVHLDGTPLGGLPMLKI